MTRRKFFKILQIIKRTHINRDLLRYIGNKIYDNSLKLSKSNKVAYPSCVMLELTNLCHNKCVICPRQYSYGEAMDKGCMNLENAKKIINEIYPYLDSIGLTGLGETFLYPHLAEIASYIKSKKKSIVISLSTNTNVPGFIDKIKETLPYIDTLQVSIDGIEDVYEQIRVNAKFDEAIRNIKEILPLTLAHKVDLMFNVVISKENFHQMSNLIELTHQLGVRYINFNYLNLVSLTNTDVDYYRFFYTPQFETELNNALATAQRLKHIEVTGLNFRGSNGFKKCPFPWTHFYITWDGYMTPCCAKPFPKILNFGNVFTDGVLPTLNSDSFINFRKCWRKNASPQFCIKCQFIEL